MQLGLKRYRLTDEGMITLKEEILGRRRATSTLKNRAHEGLNFS